MKSEDIEIIAEKKVKSMIESYSVINIDFISLFFAKRFVVSVGGRSSSCC